MADVSIWAREGADAASRLSELLRYDCGAEPGADTLRLMADLASAIGYCVRTIAKETAASGPPCCDAFRAHGWHRAGCPAEKVP